MLSSPCFPLLATLASFSARNCLEVTELFPLHYKPGGIKGMLDISIGPPSPIAVILLLAPEVVVLLRAFSDIS